MIEVLATIASGIGATKGGVDLAKQLRDALKGDKLDKAVINELTLEIQQKLIEASTAQMDLRQSVQELLDEIATLKDLGAYQVFELPAGGRVLAQVDGDGNQGPYVCTACHANGKINVLQGNHSANVLRCPSRECGATYSQNDRDLPTRYNRGGRFR